MTKEQIQNLIETNATRKCKCCNELLNVNDFYIKASKNEKHFRFNSPCKFCSNLNRNVNYQKAYHRKIKYGIEQSDYDNMLKNQNFSCAICEIHIEDVNRDFSVDHCHTTGKIRDLLCINCNSMLGMGKENKNIFKSAIKYIQKHKNKL